MSMCKPSKTKALARIRLLVSISLVILALISGCRTPQPAPTPSMPVDPSAQETLAPAAALKLLVTKSGVYHVTARDLIETGWSSEQLDPARLSLKQAGQAVPVHVTGQANELALTFYGLAPDSRYTPYRAYWLSAGDGLLAMPAGSPVQVESDDATRIEVTVTQHFEQDILYISRAPGAGQADSDQWFWQTVSAPRRITLTLPIEGEESGLGAAHLTLAVWGSTSSATQGDHHIVAYLNGERVGDHKWDGMDTRQQVELQVPAGRLKSGDNSLSLALPGDTGAAADTVLLNWAEIEYRYTASGNPGGLPATFEANGLRLSQGMLTTSGATSDLVALDVSDPLSPQWLAQGEVQTSPDSSARPAGRHYALAGSVHSLKPTIVPAAVAFDWRNPSAGADYVVIAAPALRASASPLMAWHTSQGRQTALVTTDEVYDQFGQGEPDPAAIRAFIAYALSEWSEPHPRYALLLGDASYDYRNVLGKAPSAQVVSPMVEAAFSGETSSDAWLADADEDGLPDIALGRLPAQDAAQAASLIARTLEYQQSPPAGDWQRRAVMVADPSEDKFAHIADELVTQIRADTSRPGGPLEVKPLYTNDPASVMSTLNEGALLAVYVGHGSLGLWGKDGLLTAKAVDQLANGARRPVVVNFTCLTGYFVHPTTASLGEKLLTTPNGGAVATIVPSSLTLPNDQQSFAQILIKALDDPAFSLGEALLRAQRDSTSSRDVTLTYTLLGDPALKLASAKRP